MFCVQLSTNVVSYDAGISALTLSCGVASASFYRGNYNNPMLKPALGKILFTINAL